MAAREQLLRRLGWILPLARRRGRRRAAGARPGRAVPRAPDPARRDLRDGRCRIQRQLRLRRTAGPRAGGGVRRRRLHGCASFTPTGTNELLVAMPVALAVSLVLGLVTGLPGIRFSDWSLALVAFFLVVLIPSMTNLFESTTGGDDRPARHSTSPSWPASLLSDGAVLCRHDRGRPPSCSSCTGISCRRGSVTGCSWSSKGRR